MFLACACGEYIGMVDRCSQGHSYFVVRGEILGLVQEEHLRKGMPRMFPRSRTKVSVTKTIIDRRSLNHKPCRLETGGP